jgi:hypothetical protein
LRLNKKEVHFISAPYKIAYQFLDFAIADNLLELNNSDRQSVS